MVDNPPKRFHIYCDESSQTKHRYLVIGAILCPDHIAPRIAATIDQIITPHGGTSELKWEKVKRRNLPMYQAVADGFAQMVAGNYLHYSALVVDTSKVDHKKYNDGDADLGFTKFLFTLLFKFARSYRTDYAFYVYLDDRTTKHTPDLLKLTLNARARRQNIRSFDPYRTVEFVKSHKSRLIQLTDLITGAIASATNMNYLATDASAHKKHLLEHITKVCKAPSLAVPTPSYRKDFDIWHLNLDAKYRNGPRGPRR